MHKQTYKLILPTTLPGTSVIPVKIFAATLQLELQTYIFFSVNARKLLVR